MKSNGSHKRASDSEDVNLNRLIDTDAIRNKFSDYIVGFVSNVNPLLPSGFSITEVSPTNEPDYLNTYESMNLTVEDLKKVLPNLRSKLDASSLGSVRIVSPENARVSPGSLQN